MQQIDKIYIGGKWLKPSGSQSIDIINPATEQAIGTLSLATAEDVDTAVAAARAAFTDWSPKDPGTIMFIRSYKLPNDIPIIR